MYLVSVAVTPVSRVNQSGMTLPYLYCWHRKCHICDKQMYAFRLATFSWVSSHSPSQFRRHPLARKLFSTVLFEWPKRKHVPLPVIAWNGKSKFAAIGSRLLFRPYIIFICPRTGTLLLPCNLVWQNRVCICQIQHQSCGNGCPHARR